MGHELETNDFTFIQRGIVCQTKRRIITKNGSGGTLKKTKNNKRERDKRNSVVFLCRETLTEETVKETMYKFSSKNIPLIKFLGFRISVECLHTHKDYQNLSADQL